MSKYCSLFVFFLFIVAQPHGFKCFKHLCHHQSISPETYSLSCTKRRPWNWRCPFWTGAVTGLEGNNCPAHPYWPRRTHHKQWGMAFWEGNITLLSNICVQISQMRWPLFASRKRSQKDMRMRWSLLVKEMWELGILSEVSEWVKKKGRNWAKAKEGVCGGDGGILYQKLRNKAGWQEQRAKGVHPIGGLASSVRNVSHQSEFSLILRYALWYMNLLRNLESCVHRQHFKHDALGMWGSELACRPGIWVNISVILNHKGVLDLDLNL